MNHKRDACGSGGAKSGRNSSITLASSINIHLGIAITAVHIFAVKAAVFTLIPLQLAVLPLANPIACLWQSRFVHQGGFSAQTNNP